MARSKYHRLFVKCLLLWIVAVVLTRCAQKPFTSPVDRHKLAYEYFKEDAKWYLDNIPFFECSDEQLEQVYYYRWKLFKAHIRNVGHDQYVITEFINHVPWDRDPFCTINAASMHHIYEGRWLRDKRYLDGYINNLYKNGGNNRRYSESIADATYARYLVNSDSGFVMLQLDSMKKIFNDWYDHFDSKKGLYYIPAMPDATEYTIASIDASGGKDGFEGGDAFRPTINSYMYGNAMAIARISEMKKDTRLAAEYFQKASQLKTNVQKSLWNDSLQHFLDRFKVTNQYVGYWDFIRGRELAGFAPWYFNLPADTENYHRAWQHLLDTSRLLGAFGFRTNEPSYEYYFKQFVFFEGKAGSQWNGPSWPYQTSQALTGMANFLHGYKQNVVTPSDFLKLFRLYAKQHYLTDLRLNLVENYDPNKGGPIVYYYWSNHYNHSSFNNLIITGVCGVRPSESDTLDIQPLIDDSIEYFCLDNLPYHGRSLTVVYDRDGSKYKLGKGLIVFVDGERLTTQTEQNKIRVFVGNSVKPGDDGRQPQNQALNIRYTGFPTPSASINSIPDSLFQAIDGRIWYFPEISNRWTTAGSISNTDWFAINFGKAVDISLVKICLFDDKKTFGVPEDIVIEYRDGDKWLPIKMKDPNRKIVGNTENTIGFDKIETKNLRLYFTHATKHVALVEFECY